MKDQETIDQFIALRASGKSYASISETLNISKPTLIDWGRKYQFLIQNLRAVEHEALIEQCTTSRQQRLESLGRDLKRAEEELAKRDLSTLPTGALFAIVTRLRNEVAREEESIRFSVDVNSVPQDEKVYSVIDWHA